LNSQRPIAAQVGAPRFGTGGILDAGVREQQDMMAAAKLTSHSLTSQYLARIRTIDQGGARAIIEINPVALKIALEMDRERAMRRVRGPLHGIPVLLKDCIATADRMGTSTGAEAPSDAVRAVRDAHVAALLRQAGAVIIGKTNPGQWARLRDDALVGAAPGHGAAIAAGLASLAVGTATDGSLLWPAACSGLVGIKPTLGLVSRSGILSIAAAQDTAGPMARSVADAATMLAAMTGADPQDPATGLFSGHGEEYLSALDRHGLRRARIGVARHCFADRPELGALMERALLDMMGQGAAMIEIEGPLARPGAITEALRSASLDALVAPTAARLAAPDASHPHITVPAGYVGGTPVGLSFVGEDYSDAALIRIAYGYEQATRHRRPPQVPASVSLAAR
jgi:amidase